VTTWSVVKEDSQETSSQRRYFRYAVLSLTALLVLGLGIALVPHQPAPPAVPPFSEQARASALSDALFLRSAGLALAGPARGPAPAPGSAPLERAVTLLTIQARALMLPGNPAAPGTSPAATAVTAPGQSGGASPPTTAPRLPSSAAELAVALSASGVQRLRDAETADGGMARLLAGAGTAQLLAAEDMAAAAGVSVEAFPATSAPSAPSSAPQCPSAFPSAGPAESTDDATSTVDASLASALSAAVEAEQQAVYGYQAALTRLDAASAVQASHLLEQHQDLASEAAAQGRMHCATVPPPQPGYALSTAFLEAPAAGLGSLEAGTLPVYGDVVALSTGPTRSWAVSALVAAARRTLRWGGDPGPLTGVTLDESELPQLPVADPVPGSS